ncbi:hypothetical protein [Nocardioides sp. Root190]|uniref:hypothetical protein n=1 Tax=Nocardioides sp. Root190 TaxID=1736488 RepID=UPI0012F757A0|nr:hypothetical protein [Nocardioides sp. Root190]
MGTLHPAEQAATIALLFGPFLILGVVVFIRRREEATATKRARLKPSIDAFDDDLAP